MNKFDLAMQKNGLSGLFSSVVDKFKEVVKKPSELWENEKLLTTALNPTAAVAAGQASVATSAAEKAAKEVERSKIAKAALAVIANPALAMQGANVAVSAKNPAATLLVASLAAASVTGGTTYAALGQVGATAAAQAGAGLSQGMTSQQAFSAALTQGTKAAGNYLYDLVGGTGLDLSLIDKFVSPEKITAELDKLIANGTITKDQAQTMQGVINQMRQQGKTDQEIIKELVNSDFFQTLSKRTLEYLTYPILYNDFKKWLLDNGYDYTTADRIASIAANDYAQQFAKKSTTNLANSLSGFDPKYLLLAAIPTLFLFTRK